MKKLINHREWECFCCKVKLKKKEFIEKSWIFICNRCWYYNSESIFKEYKEIEMPQLIFGIDTKETIKKSLKNKSTKKCKKTIFKKY